MSTSQNPLSGHMGGSMGNFITTRRGKENVMRSKAFHPRDANTVAQQKHRASFKLIVDMYISLGGIADLGFPQEVENQTPYTLFMAANMPGAIDKTGDVPVINYSKLLIASGSKTPVAVNGAVVIAAGIEVSYQTNLLLPNVSATDEVIALAKTKIGEVLVARQERGNEAIGTILLPYPNISAEEVECCYLFVLSADGTKSTYSVYVTVGE